MADLNAKIIPLQTEVEGRVPLDTQIDVAEIAINLTDKKIYSKNSAGEIVVLGAGADGEDGAGLPGGGFEPNYQTPANSLLRYIWSGKASNNPAAGEVDSLTGGWDLNFSTTDADGESRITEWTEFPDQGPFRFLDAQGTELWNGAINNVSNIDGGRVTVDVASPDVTFDTLTAGDEVYVDLYQTTQLPTDEVVEIPLADGDVLRYDGTNWRPRQFTINGLDDTYIPSSGTTEATWEQRRVTSLASGLQPGLAYQSDDNNGLHPQATVNGVLVNIAEAFEAWIETKTGVDVSVNRISGSWDFVPTWQTIFNYDGTDYTVDVFRFRNRSLASTSYDPRFSLHYTRPAGVPDTNGGIMRFPEFEAFLATFNGGVNNGLNNGLGLEDNSVLQWNKADLKWFGQKLNFDLDEAANVALRVDSGSGTDIPKAIGDALLWDGTNWTPSSPLSGSSISALGDVNTVTTSPSNGQALVWDNANGYWRPGTVASDAPDVALNDLTDTTLTTPEQNQFLKYVNGVWVNATLVYADVSDAPTVPQNIGDLGDVDLSLAPVAGQVLVWDGSAWKPADQTGGGGSGDTVVGALTERADVSVTESFAIAQSKNVEFSGLGEAGKFVQVTVSFPAWVRFYATAADRDSDALRPLDEDPIAGSGVLMELRTTTADEVVKITPGAIYYNNDLLPSQALYARITNETGSATVITTTVRSYTSTSTDAIDGGIFGSG